MYKGHQYTLSPELTIKKFTEKDIDPATLNDSEIGQMLQATLIELTHIELELLRSAKSLKEIAAAVESNIMAMPGDPVKHLSNEGEINGSAAGRIDVLISRRNSTISRIKSYVYLLDKELNKG